MNYLELNKRAWDKRTGIHYNSKMYDVIGFLNGKSSLKEIELNELGEVAGKSLLHLQCHFGLDTLSWARKGAVVTGLDLSSKSIEKANELKEKASLQATFICSDVYAYEKSASPTYDIVYVSYGALNWLPDLDHWARIVAKSLKPGGRLHLIEFHPAYDLHAGYSYFNQAEPDVEADGTYTENCNGDETVMATWPHPLSEVINSLIKNGISIDRLNEFPFSPYNCFEHMEEREKGRFYIKNLKHHLPLTYSIKGTRNE